MFRGSMAAVVLALAAIGAVIPAQVSGLDAEPSRATYRIAGEDAALFAPYRNAGYRLELSPTPVGESVAKVEIVAPLDVDSASVPLDPALLPADVLESLDARRVPASVRLLAQRLTARCRTVAEVQRSILAWTSSSISYDDDRSRSQDVESVLQSRAAHCVGLASLAVDLLRAAGVPARAVSGVWADVRTESRQKQASVPDRAGIYHRWVETYDPSIGWFFSDPIGRLDFVSALYLPFAERPDRAPANLKVTPIASDGSLPAERFGTDRRGRPTWILQRGAAATFESRGVWVGGGR